jgi:hypothetical protein
MKDEDNLQTVTVRLSPWMIEFLKSLGSHKMGAFVRWAVARGVEDAVRENLGLPSSEVLTTSPAAMSWAPSFLGRHYLAGGSPISEPPVKLAGGD